MSRTVRVAILDMYNNTPNRGMGNIIQLLEQVAQNYPLEFQVFETRYKTEVPDLSYDIYISSGGPGDPYDGLNTPWENQYFALLDKLWEYNECAPAPDRKHAFFICHSFQLMVRHFKLGEVTRRRSHSFGVFPVHKTAAGKAEPLFEGLADPFYAADFRHWQVVRPDYNQLQALGGHILALEKERPHVPLERAVMAIRLSPEFIGTQFHPEADPENMRIHFTAPEQQEKIIREHGQEKYQKILHRLTHDSYLLPTYRKVLPTFLHQAIQQLTAEEDSQRKVA